MSSGAPNLPNRMVTRIFLEPGDPSNNTAYVTFAGFANNNLWRTTDGGATWRNLHGTLPQVPIRAVTTHPKNPNWVYVGTEVGIFTSEDAGNTWFTTNDGPANASVEHLFWTTDTTLVAATYGRGMFRATVNARSWS